MVLLSEPAAPPCADWRSIVSVMVGIWVRDCDNNVIQGNYIGVDATGSVAATESSGNSIVQFVKQFNRRDDCRSAQCYFRKLSHGLEIGGSGNVVQGNFIGTNPAGTAAIGTASWQISSVTGFTNNLIGGTAPGAGNLISGNQRGISINGSGKYYSR